MNSQLFQSAIFPTKEIHLAGTTETVVLGKRELLPLLPTALVGIKQIGVIGYKSQGRAQARCWRDSLVGTDIKVKVGLREQSDSREIARADGFTEENDTLGDVFETIRGSDLTIMLIQDAAQVEIYKDVFACIKPGAILGFSHGFLLGYLQSIGEKFPDHFSVIGVCPKGMGNSVRRLYEQGVEINGAGINCSFAVEQDVDGRAAEVALAWTIAIGGPYGFKTTLENEYRSDIFGERSILLGAVWGMLEALFNEFVMTFGMDKKLAYRLSAENITGPISRIISKEGGLIGLYDHFSGEQKHTFEKAYVSTYAFAYRLLEEIYEEVSSGNEIRRVVMTGQRLKKTNSKMSEVGNTEMWQIGKDVRSERAEYGEPQLDPITAGIYAAIMKAQVDLLITKGHCWSEAINESIIEAIDSLNPYMHFNGPSHMIDNCSDTARQGTRVWAPRFHYVLCMEALPKFHSLGKFNELDKADQLALYNFIDSPIHEALAECSKMRPPVDIAVLE